MYAPDVSKPDQWTSEFHEELRSQIDEIPKEEKMILLGDLNTRIGNQVVDSVKQVFNEDVLNQREEVLTELCALNELRINNTFSKHKAQHKYTFLDNPGNKSLIDYIITNRTIHPKQILDIIIIMI